MCEFDCDDRFVIELYHINILTRTTVHLEIFVYNVRLLVYDPYFTYNKTQRVTKVSKL